ncbi:hypothetical protein HispidOSU_012962 [Sigmodon hispidus]
MRHSERTLRRGLAPTAASDWRTADLPAALQGEGYIRGPRRPPGGRGARARWGGSLRHYRWLPGLRGNRARDARWPPTLAAGLSRAAGARTLCGSKGTGRRDGRSGGAIPGAGLGCFLREQPVERRRSRPGQVALCIQTLRQAWGRRASSGLRHVPKSNPLKAPSEFPIGCRNEAPEEEVLHNGREQRRAAQKRGLRPPPFPTPHVVPAPACASPCAPPIAYRPQVPLTRTGDLARRVLPSILECA